MRWWTTTAGRTERPGRRHGTVAVVRPVRRDRDDRLRWVTSAVMVATFVAMQELVRHFTTLPGTTGFIVGGCLWLALTCLPVWLAGRSVR